MSRIASQSDVLNRISRLEDQLDQLEAILYTTQPTVVNNVVGQGDALPFPAFEPIQLQKPSSPADSDEDSFSFTPYVSDEPEYDIHTLQLQSPLNTARSQLTTSRSAKSTVISVTKNRGHSSSRSSSISTLASPHVSRQEMPDGLSRLREQLERLRMQDAEEAVADFELEVDLDYIPYTSPMPDSLPPSF